MLTEDADLCSDLCGRAVGMVMPLLNWRSRDLPFCVTACHGDQVVAAAWAGSVTSRETGTVGCNVSFGVRPDFGGMGLATILSAIAYQQCAAKEAMLEFVNVQTEAGNDGAHAVADRLQLERAPTFDRKTGGSAPRLYATFRSPQNVVAARCSEILASAGFKVRHAVRRLPLPRNALGVQPRVALPLSIAALLPPLRESTMPHSQAPAAAPSAAPIYAMSKARTDNETLRNALEGQHGLLPGIALVEEKLKEAKRALPVDTPFPLEPRKARLYHDAAASAYNHSLEMVSGDFLRELHAKLGPVPGANGLDAQNAALGDAFFGKYGVTSGAAVIEKCLTQAARADHGDAPFPLDHEEGAIWHRAQQTAYVYVLEMLCTDSLKLLAPQFHVPAEPAAAVDEEPAPAPEM